MIGIMDDKTYKVKVHKPVYVRIVEIALEDEPNKFCINFFYMNGDEILSNVERDHQVVSKTKPIQIGKIYDFPGAFEGFIEREYEEVVLSQVLNETDLPFNIITTINFHYTFDNLTYYTTYSTNLYYNNFSSFFVTETGDKNSLRKYAMLILPHNLFISHNNGEVWIGEG